MGFCCKNIECFFKQ